MKIIETADPDVVEVRTGGGCVSLFGLPFLLGGLFCWIGPFVLPSTNRPPWYFMIPFGIPFVAVGAALVLGRGGFIINRRQRTLTKWWGLLVPMKRTVMDLDSFTGVSITKEIRRTKDSTYTVYPVRITGPKKPFHLEEPREYLGARQAAEQVAKLLELPVADSSSGKRVVRQASELDESVRDRARRTGEVVELPDPPPGMRTQVEYGSDSIRLVLPCAGLRAQSIIMIIMGLAIPSAIIFGFLLPMVRESGLDKPGALVAFCFAGGIASLFALALVLGGISIAVSRATITVTPDFLRIKQRGLVFTKTQEIPAQEVEEFEASGAPPGADACQMPQVLKSLTGMKGNITVRSDRAHVTFGEHLAPAERAWVYAVLKNMLTL